MAFYSVEVWDNAFYPCIEADSPEQAKIIAEEWFAERCPAMHMQQIQPSCDRCSHFSYKKSSDDMSDCSFCKNFNFFEPDD